MKELLNEQQLFYSPDGASWISSVFGKKWPEEKCEGYLYKHLSFIEMSKIKRQLVDLDGYKESKKDKLREECKGKIVNLFTSNALGSDHKYYCREEDQANIVTRTKASEVDGLDKKVWACDGVEFTRIPHTTAQLQKLVVDMESHIEESQSKLEELINQVNACSNVDEVDDVVW